MLKKFYLFLIFTFINISSKEMVILEKGIKSPAPSNDLTAEEIINGVLRTFVPDLPPMQMNDTLKFSRITDPICYNNELYTRGITRIISHSEGDVEIEKPLTCLWIPYGKKIISISKRDNKINVYQFQRMTIAKKAKQMIAMIIGIPIMGLAFLEYNYIHFQKKFVVGIFSNVLKRIKR